MSDFSPAKFRAQFPVFAHAQNQSLVYLDNAATTQKPDVMIRAIAEYYSQTHANAHRASHRLARQTTELIETTRALSAQFLGASDTRGVIFTRGATESLNLLASSLGERLQADDEILLTTAEHHANLVPWQQIAEKTSAKLRFLPHKEGEPDWEAIPSFLSDKTRLFAMTAASNVLGFQAPLENIRTWLDQHREKNNSVTWVVDGAQWAAHLPVRVDAWGCDYFVCSMHKCFGPTGLGLLWGKAEALDRLPPWQCGGEMITRVQLTHSEYAPSPHRFEPGTASLSAIAAWRAVLMTRQYWPLEPMRRYENELMVCLHERLRQIPYLRLLSKEISSTGLSNVGMATFVVDLPGGHAADLAHWLDDSDIAVRSGHLCAQPLLETLGVSHVTRVSLSSYNSMADIDACCLGIEQFIASLKNDAGAAKNQTKKSEINPAKEVFLTPDFTGITLDALQKLPLGQARLRQLTQWGRRLPKQDNLRTESYRVEGCESDIWMAIWFQGKNGSSDFLSGWKVAIDTDANVLKGLAIALLLAVQKAYGETFSSTMCVKQWDEGKLADILGAIGLQQFLTPSRANGFWALFRHLKSTILNEEGRQR